MPKPAFTVAEDRQHRGRNPNRKRVDIHIKAGGQHICIASIYAERFPSFGKIKMEVEVDSSSHRVKMGTQQDRRHTALLLDVDDREFCPDSRHDSPQVLPCRICVMNGIAPKCGDGCRRTAVKYRSNSLRHGEDPKGREFEVSCLKHLAGPGWLDIPKRRK